MSKGEPLISECLDPTVSCFVCMESGVANPKIVFNASAVHPYYGNQGKGEQAGIVDYSVRR